MKKRIFFIMPVILVFMASILFIKSYFYNYNFQSVFLEKYNFDKIIDIKFQVGTKKYYTDDPNNINQIISYLCKLGLKTTKDISSKSNSTYVDIIGTSFSENKNSNELKHMSFFISNDSIFFINENKTYTIKNGQFKFDYIISLCTETV